MDYSQFDAKELMSYLIFTSENALDYSEKKGCRVSRAPFQTLVFLRRHKGEESEYLLLKRADVGVWQGVAGGGEGGEAPLMAAIRETLEETGVEISDIVDLKSVAELSALDVAGNYRWGRDIRVIPEFAFLADVPFDTEIKISGEHTEYLWCNLEGALQLLEWDSNRQAIIKAEQVALSPRI